MFSHEIFNFDFQRTNGEIIYPAYTTVIGLCLIHFKLDIKF